MVKAAGVPVTLKIRTGWAADHRNAPTIARIAEDCGIAALAVHGRTRDQQYTGIAEYDTIAEIKSRLKIPVIANGDIDSPQKARQVLEATGCDAVMIGRAAQGRPWIFREIAHFLATGETLPPPSLSEGPARKHRVQSGREPRRDRIRTTAADIRLFRCADRRGHAGVVGSGMRQCITLE